jgi:hypothetical protein
MRDIAFKHIWMTGRPREKSIRQKLNSKIDLRFDFVEILYSLTFPLTFKPFLPYHFPLPPFGEL